MISQRLRERVEPSVERTGGWWVVGAGLLALLAAGCAVGAVVFDGRNVRVLAAVAALVAAAGWAWAWPRVGSPRGSRAARLVWVGVLVLFSLLATLAFLIGLTTITGRVFADRTVPLDARLDVGELRLSWFDAGLAAVTAVVVALMTWWMGTLSRTFARFKHLRRRRTRVLIALGLALAALVGLNSRDVPNDERDPSETARVRADGAGRFDLLLAIDPADPAAGKLIGLARELVASSSQRKLLERDPGSAPYNLAYGIAIPKPGGGGRPLWRLVEPPTEDPYELAASLARIRPSSGATLPSSYGRIYWDALVSDRIAWRPGARRGVAFVLDRLPSLEQLDRGAGATGAIAPWADPEKACGAFVSERAERGPVDPDSSVPVAWGDALAERCRSAAPVALEVLTRETRESRLAPWSTWARAAGGRLHSRQARTAGEDLIADARALHTGQPVGALRAVVEHFRPHIFFDAKETLFPVDVDSHFTPVLRRGPCRLEYGVEKCEPRERDEDDLNRVCDRELGRDNCEEITDPGGLVGTQDEYIDFSGTGRFDREALPENKGASRMYVHARELGGRLYLGYWWFLAFNTSPWRSEVNCMPGLSVGNSTCFDHEGDWEGVTVVLDLVDERALPDPYRLSNLRPDSVLYEAHGHPIRWRWDQVELAAERGFYATHPVVYTAWGSHASYPARCTDPDCEQNLANSSLGEGGFDGAEPWAYNRRCDQYHTRAGERTTCLIALPTSTDGSRGVLWNAFPGRWGKASCTVIAKFCWSVDGPLSPARQSRFSDPREAKPGRSRTLTEYRSDYGGTAGSSDGSAWPPPGRPIPDSPLLP